MRHEIRIFSNRIKTRFSLFKKNILLILPCSSKKPYSSSKSHKIIIESIKKYRSYINELIMTSPLGIVPRELELIYPASHYDSTVTGFWSSDEINYTNLMLKSYLLNHNYEYIIAHVSKEYKNICKNISKELKLNIYFTCDDDSSIISQNSIKNLDNTLNKIIFENKNNLIKVSSSQEKINLLKSIASYQFGSISENLFDSNSNIKGHYPKYQLYSNNIMLATLTPNSGLLSLSVDGAYRIINSKEYNSQYMVYIDDFIPVGSILSPGIRYADHNIKPGDEVIIYGKKVIGVGKAFMSGYNMCNSSKGQAVLIRHIRKRNI